MNKYFDFEDDPVSDIDVEKAGDEVAYEDEQQEMFEHYRFDISAGQVAMRVFCFRRYRVNFWKDAMPRDLLLLPINQMKKLLFLRIAEEFGEFLKTS